MPALTELVLDYNGLEGRAPHCLGEMGLKEMNLVGNEFVSTQTYGAP